MQTPCNAGRLSVVVARVVRVLNVATLQHLCSNVHTGVEEGGREILRVPKIGGVSHKFGERGEKAMGHNISNRVKRRKLKILDGRVNKFAGRGREMHKS